MEICKFAICNNARNDILGGELFDLFMTGIKLLHSVCYTSVLLAMSTVNEN